VVRSLGFPSWCLIGIGVFTGCRMGYDEISVLGRDIPSTGGANASGGRGGTTSGGGGGTEAGAGEAGADATGGTSATGGIGGSAASGGSSATAGKGGGSNVGGTFGDGGSSAMGGSADTGGSAGDTGSGAGGSAGSTGGKGGASGGSAGTSGGTTSGGGGASGGLGGGGASGGGASGGLGGGGFAGASSLGDCQTDTYDGHDYVFCNVNLAWTVARDNCASIGMFLVRVNDAAESQWVYDNVYDAPPRQGVWIGASDIAVEGEWRWPDGTLFWLGDSAGSAQGGLFNAWYASQPSGQGPRDCAALDGSTLGWYDLDCMTPQPYVCESP
jgi:hypothetical protein